MVALGVRVDSDEWATSLISLSFRFSFCANLIQDFFVLCLWTFETLLESPDSSYQGSTRFPQRKSFVWTIMGLYSSECHWISLRKNFVPPLLNCHPHFLLLVPTELHFDTSAFLLIWNTESQQSEVHYFPWNIWSCKSHRENHQLHSFRFFAAQSEAFSYALRVPIDSHSLSLHDFARPPRYTSLNYVKCIVKAWQVT